MITQIFILYIVVATLIAFTNWRLGLFLMLIAGGLQDPVRKLTLGTPAIMVLSFMPIWTAMCFSAVSTNPEMWKRFRQTYPGLPRYIQLFLLAIMLATVIVFKHGLSAWFVAIIGIMGYLLPIIALIIGFSYMRSATDLNKVIIFYCVFTGAMLVGTALEYWGVFPGWQALGTSALNTHWVRYISWGHTINLNAGFYRSPDIMGWHAATLVMLAMTMLLSRKSSLRWVWFLAILGGMICLILSGRNKMIFMPLVWAMVVSAIYIYAGRGQRVVYLIMAGSIIIMSFAAISGKLGVEEDYFLHSTPATGMIFERVERHNVGGVASTLRQSGFFGEGIGTASTGAHHGGKKLVRTWQEGGIPKILVELGVLGLLASLALAVALFKALHDTIKRAPSHSPLFPFQVGLLGLVAANASSFIISHQAYGDGFIVTMAAFFLGLTMSAPRWYAGHQR